MNDYVIRVENVAKKFKIYFDKGHSLKEKTLFSKRNRYEEHQVLRDISFHVREGEAIGLIGENGSGKSTMLKLLSRIMYPDAGSIEMRGRISCLIELGAGFHPDMSGRENIYTNAAIFGLSHEEIEQRIDEIIHFSELGEYIDNPVRTYSSGMYMRLAFAVAINVDADILLVDEILAVGDASFQVKCFQKLQEIKRRGTTIVLVSHSLGSVEQFCDRSYWICDGKVRMEGKPRDVHPAYLEFMATKNPGLDRKPSSLEEAVEKEEIEPVEELLPIGVGESPQKESKFVTFDHTDICDAMKEKTACIRQGESIYLNFVFTVEDDLQKVVAGIKVYRTDGLHCYGTTTEIDGMNLLSLIKGKNELGICFESIGLLAGEYNVDWALATAEGCQLIYVYKAAEFKIYTTTNEVGAFKLEHRWLCEDRAE